MRVSGVATNQSTWTPTFVVFLLYVFIILTNRLPGATVVMAVAVFSLLLQHEPLRAPKFLWLFAAWLVWAGLGYLWTPYPTAVRPAVIDQAKILIVILVAVNALRTPAQIRYFMLFLVVSYLLFPIRSSLMAYAGGYTRAGRAIGPFLYGNPNDLAALTILVLGPALALAAGLSRKNLTRWIGLGAAALFIVTILLTQSRGAFLALLAMALPSGIALARRRPRLAWAFTTVIAAAAYFAPAALWERVGGLREATSVEALGAVDPEGSAQQRFEILQTAARIVDDYPVFGVGLGAYTHANLDYNPALGLKDTHNTYFKVAAETGLPGLVLFLALLVSVLRAGGAARRHAERALPAQAETLRWLLFALIGYLIASLFRSFSLTFPWVYLALLWSAAQAVRPRTRVSEPVPVPPTHPPYSSIQA